MDLNLFKERLSQIKNATSVTGKIYESISLNGSYLEFRRSFKDSFEKISIAELFQLYVSEQVLTTTIAKKYISGRVQSPAVAILNQIRSNNQTAKKNTASTFEALKMNAKLDSDDSDEYKFFKALSEVVGITHLHSKKLGKPVSSQHVYLSGDFRDFSLPKELNQCYTQILTELNSNFDYSSSSLAHHIDGMLICHPSLGTRIIEFDEEQHFTPARLVTLNHLKGVMPDFCCTTYSEICKNLWYLNNSALKKHRIKARLDQVPETFTEFVAWLKNSGERVSGYIEPKVGFDYVGGRISQRAYYDALRDTAHFSPKNINLQFPLRFAKKTFTDYSGIDYSSLSISDVKNIILKILRNDYQLELT